MVTGLLASCRSTPAFWSWWRECAQWVLKERSCRTGWGRPFEGVLVSGHRDTQHNVQGPVPLPEGWLGLLTYRAPAAGGGSYRATQDAEGIVMRATWKGARLGERSLWASRALACFCTALHQTLTWPCGHVPLWPHSTVGIWNRGQVAGSVAGPGHGELHCPNVLRSPGNIHDVVDAVDPSFPELSTSHKYCGATLEEFGSLLQNHSHAPHAHLISLQVWPWSLVAGAATSKLSPLCCHLCFGAEPPPGGKGPPHAVCCRLPVRSGGWSSSGIGGGCCSEATQPGRPA